MCGIIGGVNVSFDWVEKGLEHQKMRGPDNSHIMVSNKITFGHNRLSIIDLSDRSNQPLSDESGSVLSYNGEWYDYKHYYPYETSDSNALLKHLSKKGISALDDINGMFAFSYYDGTNIYLAVDRFAQKPLYYFHQGDMFAFASSPAALYSLKEKWELDNEALKSYWMLGSVMGENGLFKGIKKLCGSEYLVYNLESNTYKVHRYWNYKFRPNAIDEIEDVVIDAIRKVKVSDVPIHIFLSGGIDSSLVASQFEGGKSVHLDGPERKYAEQVAKKYNIDLNVINPEDTDTEQALLDYSFKCGEPTMAGIIPYIVAKEVSKYGKVAISANGADELFFGYDRTHDEISKRQLSHIFRYSALDDEKNHAGNGRMLELNTYVQFDLNKTLDFASMCFGLEVRNPFLDHNLVETALSIPEKKHRENGNKTILKKILRKQGFLEGFLNRPKQGFSLFKQPKNLDKHLNLSWNWVQSEGFLNLQGRALTGRDELYLKKSALGFYYWYQVWEHKILTLNPINMS